MPTNSINMHGKKYTLVDQTARTQTAARTKAAQLRKQGKVAFLNPQKKKGKAPKYFVYQAQKAVRKVKVKIPKKPGVRKVKAKGPTKSINMHGKKYTLVDQTVRTQAAARTKAAQLRKQGKVAFLNPQKRKGQVNKYFVYVAPKAIRKVKAKIPVKKKPGRPKKN